MPQFAPLPDSYNPSLGAAAGFASSSASVFNALKSAANQQSLLQQRQAAQQATQQATQAHQGLQDELEAIRMGGTPVTGPNANGIDPGAAPDPNPPKEGDNGKYPTLLGRDSRRPQLTQAQQDQQNSSFGPDDPNQRTDMPQSRPTLAQPDPTSTAGQSAAAPPQQQQAPASPAQSGRDVSRMHQINGNWYYFPTKSEQEQGDLNDSNSFVAKPGSDTEKFLQDQIGMKPGTRIPFSHAGAIGDIQTQLQKASDAADKKSQVGTVTQDLADKAKVQGFDLAVGTKVPLSLMKDVADAVKAPTPKAPKSLRFEPSTNDKGDVTMQGFDPETGELKSTNVAKGIGGTRKDPNATPAPKPKVMTPATARTIRNSRDLGLKQANIAYDAEMKSANTNADGSVSTADTVMGGASPFEKRRQAYAAVQNKFEQDVSEATGNDIPHNDWADRMQEFPASGTASKGTKTAQPVKPAQPAQRTAAPAAHAPPPATVTNGLAAGTHTFGNGQVWKKGADGSMVYVSGGN